MRTSIIVAIAENYAIGKNNELLWHLSADLKRFKQITTGHSIIMGRKTFESIGKPLPNRRSVVITRDKNFSHEGITVVHSIAEALEIVKHEEEIFIIGGGTIYEEMLPKADRIYLTTVHKSFDADTFFPKFDTNQWQIVTEEELPCNDKNPYPTTFQILERKKHLQAMMSPEHMQQFCSNTLVAHLGIEFTALTANTLSARMPVDNRTKQPFGILHGGASLALIETVGSGLSVACTDTEKFNVFGMAVNANHVKPAKQGYVYAKAYFLHKGNRTQIVNVCITNDAGELICDGRITNIIVPK